MRTLGVGIASPGQKAEQPMPRWVTQDTFPVSAISLECCPPSERNGVRDRVEYAPHPRVPAPQGLRAELVTHAPSVAPGGPVGAQETAAQAHCLGATSHPNTVQSQHGLGL